MKEKICLVLDVDSRDKALGLVRSLHDLTGMFKVGLQLFTAEGPSLVRDIIAAGGKVFLDLKFSRHSKHCENGGAGSRAARRVDDDDPHGGGRRDDASPSRTNFRSFRRSRSW
jgi:hypothetical protein